MLVDCVHSQDLVGDVRNRANYACNLYTARQSIQYSPGSGLQEHGRPQQSQWQRCDTARTYGKLHAHYLIRAFVQLSLGTAGSRGKLSS